MNIIIRSCLFLLLIFSMTGCGTLLNRVAEPRGYYGADYYKGTQYDVQLLFFGDGVNNGHVPFSLFCWVSIACPVITVFSLPADILVDTILLPSDIHEKKQRDIIN